MRVAFDRYPYRTSYAFKHPFDWTMWHYQETKYFFQRGWRGWADGDVWSLDVYVADVMGPLLRHYMTWDPGTPLRRDSVWNDADPGSNYLTPEEYNVILLQMIEGFEAVRQAEDLCLQDWPNIQDEMDAEEALRAKTMHGLELFKEYYFSLWV